MARSPFPAHASGINLRCNGLAALALISLLSQSKVALRKKHPCLPRRRHMQDFPIWTSRQRRFCQAWCKEACLDVCARLQLALKKYLECSLLCLAQKCVHDRHPSPRTHMFVLADSESVFWRDPITQSLAVPVPSSLSRVKVASVRSASEKRIEAVCFDDDSTSHRGLSLAHMYT